MCSTNEVVWKLCLELEILIYLFILFNFLFFSLRRLLLIVVKYVIFSFIGHSNSFQHALTESRCLLLMLGHCLEMKMQFSLRTSNFLKVKFVHFGAHFVSQSCKSLCIGLLFGPWHFYALHCRHDAFVRFIMSVQLPE